MANSSGETSGGTGTPETERDIPETPSTPMEPNVAPEANDPYAKVLAAMQAAEDAVANAVQAFVKLQNQK
jgi:hypothetical protein